MKKLIFAIVAMFLLQGVSSNVTAQNPVKKVKYLKHKYEGEVGKKKVPEGKGIMTFEGFTVKGDFRGNEVTNATLSIDNSDISYNGNLSFDESQNITLKSGGIIQAIVYERYSNSRLYERDHITSRYLYDGIYFQSELKGRNVILGTVSSDKVVDISKDLAPNKFKFSYTIPHEYSELIKELNPPTFMDTYQGIATIIGLGYEKYNNTTYYDCYLYDNFEVFNQSRLAMSNKNGYIYKKYIYILYDSEFIKTSQSFEDDKGRIWKYNGVDELSFTCQRADGLEINWNNSDGIECKLYDSDKKKTIASWYHHTSYRNAKYDKLISLLATFQQNNIFLLPWPSEIYLYDCKSMSDSEIEQLLRTKIFPNFEGKPQDADYEDYRYTKDEYYMKEWYVDIQQKESNSGSSHNLTRYYYRSDIIASEETVKESKRKKDEEDKKLRMKEDTEIVNKLFAQLDPFIKRFGFNPLDRGLKDIVKVGTSFKLISDYFKLTKKFFYFSRNKSESFKKDFPGEEFVNIMYNKEAEKKNFYWEGYYYSRLSIDHGTRKCYDLRYWNMFHRDDQICYVWVSGDKITSVVW